MIFTELSSIMRRLLNPGRADRRHKIVRSAVVALAERTGRLEERMSDVERAVGEKLGALIGVVVAESASVREGIREKDAALAVALADLAKEREDRDETVERMVREALELDSTRDAERVSGWLEQLSAALPPSTTVPSVDVPPVGAPAQVPEESGLEIPATPEADGRAEQ